MRRAAGDVAGKTIAAQIRQAARHLGYALDDWRVREAWYGRAGRWSGAALDDLRQRSAAWRDQRQAAAADPVTPAQRIAALRRLLAEVEHHIARLEAHINDDREGRK